MTEAGVRGALQLRLRAPTAACVMGSFLWIWLTPASDVNVRDCEGTKNEHAGGLGSFRAGYELVAPGLVASVCSGNDVSRSKASSGASMTSIGDGQFHKGQPVWVIAADGSERAAEFVGEGELSAWFGGSSRVIVVYLDTRTGEAVEVDRVIPRDV